jgi:predicted lipase
MAKVVPSTDFISHNDALDMLRATMLVYAYGKKFKVDDENETAEKFVSEMKGHEMDSLNDASKAALLEIASNVSSAKVCEFISDKETDVQVGVTINSGDKRICIIFRGSESVEDWLHDFKIVQRKIKGHEIKDGVRVHRGFYQQLHHNGVYDKLLAKVKQLLEDYPDYSIYVTGHSLGAALSTLCGFRMSCDLENKVTVVSFASPRVGNAAWKKAFDQKSNLTHYRVTNGRDLITAFPFCNYCHVGKTIRLFKRSCKFFEDYSRFRWYDFTILTCWRASDHMCGLYYERLKQHKW